MLTARLNMTSSVVNGKIYVIGGETATGVINTVEEYDPVTDTWRPVASMPTARSGLGGATVNGIIYAIGGDGFFTVEAYTSPAP